MQDTGSVRFTSGKRNVLPPSTSVPNHQPGGTWCGSSKTRMTRDKKGWTQRVGLANILLAEGLVVNILLDA